jgi:hypothetical protein
LTEIFGAGVEPSKETMDAYILGLGGYFQSGKIISEHRTLASGASLIVNNYFADGKFTGSGVV